MVDHRASPGLPPEIARQMGYDPSQVCEGAVMETGTMTCAHCRRVVVKNPLRTRERARCFKCDHYVCDVCAFGMSQPDYSHAPFEKQADDVVNADAKGFQLGSNPALLIPKGEPHG